MKLFNSSVLDEIGKKHGTEKSSMTGGIDYLRKYEFFLKGFKDEEFTLLELGIYHGSSLKTWEEYFPRARIVGVDIDAKAAQYAGGRIEVIIGDLSDETVLESLGRLGASIILDDASHIWSHQLNALFNLYRTLPSGGLFILEDIQTSFKPVSRYYKDDFLSVPPAAVLYKIAEYMTANLKPIPSYPDKPLRPISKIRRHHKKVREIADSADAAVFIHGSCILVKK